MPTRNDAWKLLCEYTQSESLRKHMLAVEACVRAYARKSGADENTWGLAALLHDFDNERLHAAWYRHSQSVGEADGRSREALREASLAGEGRRSPRCMGSECCAGNFIAQAASTVSCARVGDAPVTLRPVAALDVTGKLVGEGV